jgi:hypothetical protein
MRKRSKYRPKGVRIDTMAYVMSGLKKFDDVEVAIDVRLKNHLAMEALRTGKATKDEVDVLIGTFNMVEGLCRLNQKFGQDWSKEIREGQDALLTMSRRGVESGRFVCTVPELAAMNLVMQIHDAQLDSATVKDVELAVDIVNDDLRNKRARIIKETTA